MDSLLTPIKVFYSFAAADAPLLEQLENHLSVLQREGLIATWHAHQIGACDVRQAQIDQHLQTASLILLLISPAFLASRDQYEQELRQALQRHEHNEACVIPILLRSCLWESASFAQFQVLPRNKQPITSWLNLDEAFTEVAREIRATLETLPRLMLKPSPTTLPKIWQVPYPRNPVFTGREDLLAALAATLAGEHAAALSQPQALSGLGGVGKTQLAVEYAYRFAQRYQAVFWVSAEKRESIISGYAALAGALNLRAKDEQDQSMMLNAVRLWLQRNTSWLLILDNADDLTLIQPFLPPTFGGHILLTTRAQPTGRFARRVEVDTLPRDEGALLLLRRATLLAPLGLLDDAPEQQAALARQLSKELGDLPLALDQAGAYIEETGCGLSGYQQRYRVRRTTLLQWRGTLVTDHPESVATTWSLSFEKVEQTNPLAADLLRFCTFLAPDAIPEELLLQALATLPHALMPEATEPESSEETTHATFEQPEQASDSPDEAFSTTEQAEISWALDQAVMVLRAYSFIQRDAQEHTLQVHRLVQAVLQEKMANEVRHKWAQRVVCVITRALPEIEFENWGQCERYVPHAQACAQLEEAGAPAEEAEMLHWLGRYLLIRQRIQGAELYIRQALALREQHLGTEHLKTAESMSQLARWWQIQSRYAEAEPLVQRTLTICEQQLGLHHPSTATILNNLALLYRRQGRYAEAEPLYLRDLAICEQQLGLHHPDTATTLGNLAVLYKDQGRYAEAEPLFQRALAIREQQLSHNHPDIAIALNHLSNLYESQGRYTEAEPFARNALAICEQQLGDNHLDTIASLNNLANIYNNQGHYAKAALLYQRALASCEQQLGFEYPNTQHIRRAYISLLRTMGHDEEANRLEEHS